MLGERYWDFGFTIVPSDDDSRVKKKTAAILPFLSDSSLGDLRREAGKMNNWSFKGGHSRGILRRKVGRDRGGGSRRRRTAAEGKIFGSDRHHSSRVCNGNASTSRCGGAILTATNPLVPRERRCRAKWPGTERSRGITPRAGRRTDSSIGVSLG